MGRKQHIKIATTPLHVLLPNTTWSKFYDLCSIRGWKTNIQGIVALIEEDYEKRIETKIESKKETK